VTPLRTFASDVTPWPKRRDDWEGCARLAGELLGQRQQQYPGLVERQKLSPDQAERGLRVMGAIARLWEQIAAGEDIYAPNDCLAAFGASLAEMQAEIATSRDRLRQIAARPEADGNALRNSEFGEALWWHLQPITDGSLPHIWIAHNHARWERAQTRRGRAA
jgi:hypothetical protein